MNTRSSEFNNPNNWVMSNPENLFYAGTGHNAEIITDDTGKDWMCYHAYWQGNNYNGRCIANISVYFIHKVLNHKI